MHQILHNYKIEELEIDYFKVLNKILKKKVIILEQLYKTRRNIILKKRKSFYKNQTILFPLNIQLNARNNISTNKELIKQT